jgi:DNA-binding NtrC family response regulator
MPGRSGIALASEMRDLRERTPVVLMTAFGSMDSAIEAMRAGAFDYITKPFKREAVLVTLERALEHRALKEENTRLRRAVDQTSALGDLVGASPAMRDLFALVKRVGSGRASVLITGESGTGKEVVARTLHFSGARGRGPFVPVNCTALPEGLLESELFGHVRGAFTGAHASKRGLFEEANGGTLFLDEIGDMGPTLQGKLLRVLQDHEIRPVGGNTSVKVDVRIVAATNRDLRAEIEAGRFRNDLYYRLNVIPIHIPPLRERPEDVAPLANQFLRRHSPDRVRRFTPAALASLARRRWEGNARELENFIERVLAFCDGDVIDASDLPELEAPASGAQRGPDDSLDFAVETRMTVRDLEDRYIERVLRFTGGNKVQAARILGINRRTLYRREEHKSEAALAARKGASK